VENRLPDEAPQGTSMIRLFLIALLVLNSGPASAEWVSIGSSAGEETVYVDPETVRRRGELVEVWVLFDHKLAKQLSGTKSYYLSSRDLQEYNCKKERYRFLDTTWFSDNMGKGASIKESGESAWRPIPPNSVGRALMELVCKQ
jgi:hypothetical protein